ncbi:hypothetical protein [Streptomyces sp. NPDC056479]|uniref:hypothetical protein n=1 Tax=unclassified Streptomyces TaxID=2593676 RepID=UPI00368AA471
MRCTGDSSPTVEGVDGLTTAGGKVTGSAADLNYTGGTTGLPKGCEHSQRHMLYTATTAAASGMDLSGLPAGPYAKYSSTRALSATTASTSVSLDCARPGR